MFYQNSPKNKKTFLLMSLVSHAISSMNAQINRIQFCIYLAQLKRAISVICGFR